MPMSVMRNRIGAETVRVDEGNRWFRWGMGYRVRFRGAGCPMNYAHGEKENLSPSDIDVPPFRWLALERLRRL